MKAASIMVILSLALTPFVVQAYDLKKLRQLAAENNVTCMLVFGDSSVDPGNNNYLATDSKGNFPPYGEDFLNHQATGRLSNGKLASDLIAEAFVYKAIIPGFLDPTLKKEDLVHGASFASASSGYDDLTANLSNVLTLPRQLKYFQHYKIHLRQLMGVEEADKRISNGIFLLSMGSNDFVQNYFLEPIRPQQYTLDEYQNLLVNNMFKHIKVMHRLGARRLVVVGLPPLGCLPLIRTIKGTTNCADSYNEAAFSFNSKVKAKLEANKASLGMKVMFLDTFSIMVDAISNPQKYGFTETGKGCCGTGTIEYADTCKGQPTCPDRSKYIFWDAVHPTEKTYKILVDEALETIGLYLG
ncbi:GDSL lipase/esterase [Dillenia turbinata]|uniref:GDSL lipase/esterase n=1 Tax=Dillenia turbinata TaxID=194707 RepID=A0AAN8UNX5_9MAGN